MNGDADWYRARLRKFAERGWVLCAGSWLSDRGMVATVRSRLLPSRYLYPVRHGLQDVGVAELSPISADRLGVLIHWNLDRARVAELIDGLRRSGPGPATVTLETTEHEILRVSVAPGGLRGLTVKDLPKVRTSREAGR